jgi:hypothetical protein
MSKSPRTPPVSTQAKGVRRISSKTNVLGDKDKAVILPIPFLKAERNVGQGVLQDSYGRMGKMGLNPDIERLSHRSHCLFSLPPLLGGYEQNKNGSELSRVAYQSWRASSIGQSQRSTEYQSAPRIDEIWSILLPLCSRRMGN